MLIDNVAADSDGGKKGLKRGDVIVQTNERPVATPAEVVAAVAEARKAGRPSVLLLINRMGRTIGLALKLDPAK